MLAKGGALKIKGKECLLLRVNAWVQTPRDKVHWVPTARAGARVGGRVGAPIDAAVAAASSRGCLVLVLTSKTADGIYFFAGVIEWVLFPAIWS